MQKSHHARVKKENVSISVENRNIHNKRSRYLKSLKGIIIILCLVGFFFNSFMIFKQFIGNETVVTNKIQENTKLYLPSITLCGFSGFKRMVDQYSELKYENYINNTIDINEMLIEIADRDNKIWKAEPLLGTTIDETGRWKISTIYSGYRGRCYTIEYKRKVYDPHKYLVLSTHLNFFTHPIEYM